MTPPLPPPHRATTTQQATMSVLVVAALSLVTPAAPIPPPPPSPHQCGAANCTFDLELDTTTGIPWVLGDFAVRQTNCVFLDRRCERSSTDSQSCTVTVRALHETCAVLLRREVHRTTTYTSYSHPPRRLRTHMHTRARRHCATTTVSTIASIPAGSGASLMWYRSHRRSSPTPTTPRPTSSLPLLLT